MIERANWICDEQTGFPLPIYPYVEAPTVMTKHGVPYHKDPDDHHFFFPKRLFLSSELRPGGHVVRVSRIQSTRRFYHDRAHALMDPPPLLENPEQQFGMSLLALLNYVPRQAIALDGSQPEGVDLSENEYELLRKMTRVDFTKGYHASIGRFFLQTMLNEHMQAIDNNLTCKFLEAKNYSRKRQIGNRILKIMSLYAVEPIEPTYANLRKKGEIPTEQPTPYETVVAYARKVRDQNQIIEEALTGSLKVDSHNQIEKQPVAA